MMSTSRTKIGWTDKTWNPTRGCRRVSPGCAGCYAERQAYRFSGPGLPYEGLVELGKNGPRWTGRGRLVTRALEEPRSWKKPERVFVDSMSDLFFEAFTNEEIAAVFGVMANHPHLTFQVLTKRSKRMVEWFRWIAVQESEGVPPDHVIGTCASNYVDCDVLAWRWPLPNVWIGVSVEDQAYADQRIPDLLRVPAALRFVSYEPALGPVDFDRPICPDCLGGRSRIRGSDGVPFCEECDVEMEYGSWLDAVYGIGWVIVGGESGPGARPFDVNWAVDAIRKCRNNRVPVFCKQLGSNPHDSMRSIVGGWMPGDPEPDTRLRLRHGKGEDPTEWEERLRVQEFPEVRT